MKIKQSKFDDVIIIAAHNSGILTKKIKEIAESVVIIDIQYNVTHDNSHLLYTALILYKGKLE